jgi:2-methylcitrate dehydratase
VRSSRRGVTSNAFALTARYPGATPARVSVMLHNGEFLSREQDDFEGAPSRPLTQQRTEEKFHRLAERYADEALRKGIIDAVAHLDEAPVSVLTELLANVSAQPRKDSHDFTTV